MRLRVGVLEDMVADDVVEVECLVLVEVCFVGRHFGGYVANASCYN